MSAVNVRNATGRRHSQRRLGSVSRWLERPQRSCWRQNVSQSEGASVSTRAVDWYTVRQPVRSSSLVSTRSSPTCCGTPQTVWRTSAATAGSNAVRRYAIVRPARQPTCP